MFFNTREYIEPEIEIIKFGSEDIITSSPDETDPWIPDPFEE